MSQIHLVRSHVERCLQEIWEIAEIITDGQGAIPFRGETCVGWVVIEEGPPIGVRVSCDTVVGVECTNELLIELNDLNSRARWATFYWIPDRIVIDRALHIESLDLASLAHSVGSVITVADDLGPTLARVFGGRTPHPEQQSDQSEEPDSPDLG